MSETVWNWGNGIGSGGGISTQYPIPSWQTNINMTANQGSTTMRNMPDVALTADNVYVRADGRDYNVGGHQLRGAVVGGLYGAGQPAGGGQRQAAVGFINPAVYAIGSGANYTVGFPRHHHRQQHQQQQPDQVLRRGRLRPVHRLGHAQLGRS